MYFFNSLWVVLPIFVVTVQTARDDCDFDNSTLKKMCRKVESQAQYMEKMVDNLYKSETVFKWYTQNKDWLTHVRLPRMMKRMLNTRRIPYSSNGETSEVLTSGSPTLSSVDKFSPSTVPVLNPSASLESEENSELIEVESKLAQLSNRVESLTALVNTTQTQVQQLVEHVRNNSNVSSDLARNITHLSHQLQHYHNESQIWSDSLADIQLNVTKFVQSQSKLEMALTAFQSKLDNHNCSSQENATNSTGSVAPPEPIHLSALIANANGNSSNFENLTIFFESGFQKLQWEYRQDLQALQDRLRYATEDLRLAITSTRADNEAAVANFSRTLESGLQRMLSTVDRRLDETSTGLYNTILNTTNAFTEDLFVMRSIVANSSQQVAYLLGQDLKSQRYLEDMRSTGRRQDGLMQGFSNQLNDFRTHVQDQLSTLKNSFTMTVQELYQKIVERQNQISYRMSTLVDELRSVKGRMRGDGGSNKNTDSNNNLDEDEDKISLPDLDINVEAI